MRPYSCFFAFSSFERFWYLSQFTPYNDRNLILQEENVIKDTRNLFRLKKELNYTAVRDKINLLRLEKQTKAINDY